MKNYVIVSCIFGIIIGLIGSIDSIVGPIDKAYKIVMNIILGVVVLAAIIVPSMLRVDWNLNKNQILIGGVLEVGTLLLVFVLVSKLISKS